MVQIYVCPLLPSNKISWVGIGGMCLLIRSSQEREHPSELSPPPPSRVQQLPRPSTHPAFPSSIMWPQVLWPRILVWSCASTQKAWPQRKQLGAVTQRALGLGADAQGRASAPGRLCWSHTKVARLPLTHSCPSSTLPSESSSQNVNGITPFSLLEPSS